MTNTFANDLTAMADGLMRGPKGNPELVLSGFAALDQRFGGIVRGEAHVLLALDGVGKSTVALLAAMRAAAYGTRVLFISLEDTHYTISYRVLSMLSGVPSTHIHRRVLTADDKLALARARSVLSEVKIDVAALTDAPLNVIVDRIGMQPYDLVFVDYVQELPGSGPAAEQLETSAKRVHQAVAAQRGAVVFLSQVTESGEGGPISPFDFPARNRINYCKRLGRKSRATIALCKGTSIPGMTQDTILAKLVKNTHGEPGLRWSYVREANGLLREVL